MGACSTLISATAITDGKGRTVDFKNTVVIMTSNMGSQFIAEKAVQSQGGTGALDEGTRRQVMDVLRAEFRPEFLNRIDEIIFFHALTREHMKQIIDIQVSGLLKRLEERKIHVQLSDEAKTALVQEGYDPTYGARPLKRTIQERVENPLAGRVLRGEFGEGDTIRVDHAGGAYSFVRA